MADDDFRTASMSFSVELVPWRALEAEPTLRSPTLVDFGLRPARLRDGPPLLRDKRAAAFAAFASRSAFEASDSSLDISPFDDSSAEASVDCSASGDARSLPCGSSPSSSRSAELHMMERSE